MERNWSVKLGDVGPSCCEEGASSGVDEMIGRKLGASARSERRELTGVLTLLRQAGGGNLQRQEQTGGLLGMRWIGLEDICAIQIGKTPSRSVPAYWGGELPWATISDMSAGRQLNATKEAITDLGVRESGSRLIPKGTLLLSFKLSLGKRAIAGIDLFTNEAIAALQILDRSKADRDYLYWALGSLDYDKLVDRAAKGRTLNKAKLRRLQIPLPPLAEQKRIAGILDAADALRAKRRESLTQLDALLQSTFLSLFGDPVENPMGWQLKVLADCVFVQGGFAFKSKDYGENGVRLVKIANVHSGNLKWDEVDHVPGDYLQRYRDFALEPGDLVIALTRPIIKSLDSVKIATVGSMDTPSLLNQRVARFVFSSKRTVDKSYLLAFCRTQFFRNSVQRFCSESLQPNMSTRQLGSVLIAQPPLPLQRRFATIVNSIEAQKARLRIHLTELDALFASLQHRAFNGEL
jgi:type I restriction enzyme, S subunit